MRFDVEAEIGTDASLTVTERIAVVAEGKDIRRGIIRSIPTDFTDSEGKVRRAPLDLVSALLDGKPTQAQVSRAGERLEFRLGDPDVLLSFGEHVFTITYVTAGQLGFFDQHDELYWNATGNDWPFVIEKASFRAKLPGRDFRPWNFTREEPVRRGRMPGRFPTGPWNQLPPLHRVRGSP